MITTVMSSNIDEMTGWIIGVLPPSHPLDLEVVDLLDDVVVLGGRSPDEVHGSHPQVVVCLKSCKLWRYCMILTTYLLETLQSPPVMVQCRISITRGKYPPAVTESSHTV